MARANVDLVARRGFDSQTRTGNGTLTQVSGAATAKPDGAKQAYLLLQVHSITGAPSALTADLSLEDSADGTTFASVAGGGLATGLGINAVGNYLLDFPFAPDQPRGFVRPAATLTFTGGTTPAAVVSSSIVYVDPRYSS